MNSYRRNAEDYRQAADQWADRRGYEQFRQWLRTGRTLGQARFEMKAELHQLADALTHVDYLMLAEREERGMTRIDDNNVRRALDRWAVGQGWADFDLYIAAGNSWREAKRDLLMKRNDIDLALAGLGYVQPVAGPEALAEHEAQVSGLAAHEAEPIQGADE